MERLEARHLADLTFAEVRRAVQALSSLYVARRGRIADGAALDGAGKRAAFALFYGPLHFLLVHRIVAELGAHRPPPRRVLDLGCGSGVAGAAWALAAGGAPEVRGVDASAWAVGEARRTLHDLGVRGSAGRGELVGARLGGEGLGVVAAFAVNELRDAARAALLSRIAAAAGRGARILVIEPVARGPVPWWDAWRAAAESSGGRADTWRFEEELPDVVARLDRAAGLDHRALTGRSLWWPGDAGA